MSKSKGLRGGALVALALLVAAQPVAAQGADNRLHTPAMIHRALLGSFERFVCVYL